MALLVTAINWLWIEFSTDATYLIVDCDDRFLAPRNCVKGNTESKIEVVQVSGTGHPLILRV